MKITEKEKDFLNGVYNNTVIDEDHGFSSSEIKRLDSFFISHLTKKKIRFTNNLIINFYLLIQLPVVADMKDNGDISDAELTILINKFENYLGIN